MAELLKLGPDVAPVWAPEGPQHPDDLVSGLELAAMAGLRIKADIALVPCDREEMVGVALYLFYHNIPFAQFHAGDTGSGVHDEVGRWIISRCANLHFCNSPESAQNLVKMGEEPWRVHFVGSTAFDDIGLDTSKVPEEPFDLLLIHPDTYSMEETHRNTLDALRLLDKYTILIGPNHDLNWEVVDMDLSNYIDGSNRDSYYREGLPRAQFLALMKHCKRFITNSSSALYELPAFDITKWVSIGRRNAERKPLEKIEPGASKRIAEILKTVELDDDKLLRKSFLVP